MKHIFAKGLWGLFGAVIAFSLVGCATNQPTANRTPIDQVPMYGNMDRSSIPELKAADEAFIAGITKEYGSREQASKQVAMNGFIYSRQGQWDIGIKRFNQAWLLDPNNYEAYYGFSMFFVQQNKFCEAMAMIEKALSLNPPHTVGIYSDAGGLFTMCAMQDKSFPLEKKALDNGAKPFSENFINNLKQKMPEPASLN